MSLLDALARVGRWVAARPTHSKVLFCLALLVLLVELGFRRFAPSSRAYARWASGFEAVGAVWTTVILSIIYAFSVGPVSLCMRLLGKDPLDRTLQGEATSWRPHEPNPLGVRVAARHQF